MKNLTTRKIVLGLLMSLVLAFSGQGIADALTLNATSDTTQEKQPNDVPFELKFSAGLTSPIDINDYNQNSRHTKASVADIAYAAGTSTRDRVAATATIIIDASYVAGDTRYYTLTATTVLLLLTTRRFLGLPLPLPLMPEAGQLKIAPTRMKAGVIPEPQQRIWLRQEVPALMFLLGLLLLQMLLEPVLMLLTILTITQ
jgi:hypothetical protein